MFDWWRPIDVLRHNNLLFSAKDLPDNGFVIDFT
jgi:hypothetical protein